MTERKLNIISNNTIDLVNMSREGARFSEHLPLKIKAVGADVN